MEHAKANRLFCSFGRDCKRPSSVQIESFTDGISTWIVRHGHRLLDVIHQVQFRDYSIFKTSALITVNAGQNPIDSRPIC